VMGASKKWVDLLLLFFVTHEHARLFVVIVTKKNILSISSASIVSGDV
jgi:hypothetical protein